nr:MAG TPA: hypothetical protein [Caudoviricetes sp.]
MCPLITFFTVFILFSLLCDCFVFLSLVILYHNSDKLSIVFYNSVIFFVDFVITMVYYTN